MRGKNSSIIAIISIVLYAAAIVTGAVRIFAGISERRGIAQREFYDLKDVATSAGALGFMEEPFKNAVEDFVLSSKTLQGVIVTGPFDEKFTFPPDGNGIIAWQGDTPQFQKRFGVSRDHVSSLRVDGLRNVTIMAVSNDIDYAAFSLILKQSLLTILAAVLLSAAALVINSLGAKKPAEIVGDGPQDELPPAPPPESKPAEEKAPAAPVPDKAAEDSRVAKLDAELRRCFTERQDLSLVLMDMSLTAGFGAGDDATVYRAFADRAIRFFGHRENAFKWGDRGIAITLPSATLEESFAKAKEFHGQMLADLPEIFPHDTDLRIGIAARSDRALGADRLLLEASKALERANADPDSPIVAFKSDPEKYKAFLQKREDQAAEL